MGGMESAKIRKRLADWGAIPLLFGVVVQNPFRWIAVATPFVDASADFRCCTLATEKSLPSSQMGEGFLCRYHYQLMQITFSSFFLSICLFYCFNSPFIVV
ncbi:hypothetical protein BX070DRAFT_130497 [Coemansia spiralis]|nr:hypothetical protein BX070DRAFT_130497 [Coemansia spiralis]